MSVTRIHIATRFFLFAVFLIAALKVDAQPLPRAEPEEVGLSSERQAFGSMRSAGQYWWWGAASTRIVIDPSEEMVIIFMTQLFPMNGPLVFQFEDMVFQSIID